MAYRAPSRYKGKGSYSDLTDAERAHWNEYTNLRLISDWPGFDAAQLGRRSETLMWINNRMTYLVMLAAGQVDNEKPGWHIHNRGLRYDYLSRRGGGRPRHEVTLPCPGSATDLEKVYIEEREVYLVFASTTKSQKERKSANARWLVQQRKRLFHLGQHHGWNRGGRTERYRALCIATQHGEHYKEWDETHTKYGTRIKPVSSNVGKSGTGSKQRDDICDWLDLKVGIHENPQGSNRGEPQPSRWQYRVYGGDGVPWCACFAVCSAWDNGISGSGTASVGLNAELAREGRGIYREYTTDASKVRPGDHCFNGGNHTGVARGTLQADGTLRTVEGNTSGSTTEGSQWNGDLVAAKSRHHSYWTGFGLVRVND